MPRKIKSFLKIRLTKFSIAYTMLTVGIVLVPLAFMVALTSDFFGRMIDTQIAPGVGDRTSSDDIPTVRLVLHRLPDDENSVEASLMVISEGAALTTLIKEGKTTIRAIVHDGSSLQPYGLQKEVTLGSSSGGLESGVLSATESIRFSLPVLSSVGGFPFDDKTVRPIIDVMRDGNYTRHYRLEIQKAMPGRWMYISTENIPKIRLTRSPTEKAIVLTASLVFLFLAGILVYHLFSTKGLHTLQDLLAVAGYLVAAAGFREVLGVSRSAGTSALEIAVIGVPLVVLAFGVGVSGIRGRKNQPKKRTTGDT